MSTEGSMKTVHMAFDPTPCQHRLLEEKFECWHGDCVVGLIFRDGSLWLVNDLGSARRFPAGSFRLKSFPRAVS